MIELVKKIETENLVEFREGGQDSLENQCLFVAVEHKPQNRLDVKEAAAKIAKAMKSFKITEANFDVSFLLQQFGEEGIKDLTEGLMLGSYEQRNWKETKDESLKIGITGIVEGLETEVWKEIESVKTLVEGIVFARDMVNLPGNKLRPEDFVENIRKLVENLPVDVEIFDEQKLREMGMDGLLAVGGSSAYPPRLVVLRYLPLGDKSPVTALVGKGVTCDTGGYCLKPAGSMLGIKGDMAGGAAVAGAVYALAKNQVQANVIAVIPTCENRISNGSLLPGDVISSYAGKSIEILNTDAEGRLILADAVAYAVQQKQVQAVCDIATLTGAVVNLLGFSIAGAICDNDCLYKDFQTGYEESGERYLRVPFYKEHEKMIESQIADIKNMGENYCGTITAGLFIRAFAGKTPWLHLDIAGTAWVDNPVFEYQTKGATGAGVSSLYYMCCNRGE